MLTSLKMKLFGDPAPDGAKGLLERSGFAVFITLLLTVLTKSFVESTPIVEALRANAEELLNTLLVALGLSRAKSYK